jgi:small subunit ribosomal protein S29
VERHHDTGLYLQPQLAQEFLEQITEANREVFKTIPVNKEIWGKYNFSGVHDDDVDPVPNLYDKRRKYHFNDHQ